MTTNLNHLWEWLFISTWSAISHVSFTLHHSQASPHSPKLTLLTSIKKSRSSCISSLLQVRWLNKYTYDTGVRVILFWHVDFSDDKGLTSWLVTKDQSHFLSLLCITTTPNPQIMFPGKEWDLRYTAVLDRLN